MARFTHIRENAVFSSDVFDDTLAAGATLESGATDLEDDLNGLRSQMKRTLGETNWYDALSGRNLATLSTDLTDIENKVIVCNATVLTDVTVPAAQNWKILDVSSSEAPTENAAVGANTEGAIVAQSALNGAGFDVHELIEVAGPTALAPLNLLAVRDATTKQPIQSDAGGNLRDVFGLLQYESTGADGGAFDDVSGGNRVKISFVRINAAGTDLEAVPVADIENETVEYNYLFNRLFDNIDRNCFVGTRSFVDQSASVDVTLNNAIDNQVGKVTQAQNIEITLSAGVRWEFEDAAGATVFQIVEGSAGGTTEILLGTDVDEFDVDAAVNDFLNGVTIRSGGARPIAIGVSDGIVESTAGDLGLTAANEFALVDGNKAGSTYAGQLKLSEDAAEWSLFETNFGEVSLLNAINQAANTNQVTKTSAIVVADVAADADVGGAGGGTNLDTQIHDLSGGTFTDDHDVYLNGTLLRGGADATANFDYYPGTSLADGQLRFEFPLEGSDAAKRDKLTVISRA